MSFYSAKKKIKNIAAFLIILIFLPYVVSIFVNGKDVNLQNGSGHFTIKVARTDPDGTELDLDLDWEEYLIGVLAYEMPESYELEALKAQAVVLRTSLCRELAENEEKTATEKYLTHAEMKRKWGAANFDTYLKKYTKAVEDTEGTVVWYNEACAWTPYHQSSNGETRNASEVLGTEDYPYICKRECPLDKAAEDEIQVTVFDYQEIQQLCRDFLVAEENSESAEKGYNFADFEILEMDSSGYVRQMRMGDTVCTGDQFRDALSLSSSAFSFYESIKGLKITTIGKGHGLGMSQWTANEMAKEKKNYEEILQFFFDGIGIVVSNHATAKSTFSCRQKHGLCHNSDIFLVSRDGSSKVQILADDDKSCRAHARMRKLHLRKRPRPVCQFLDSVYFFILPCQIITKWLGVHAGRCKTRAVHEVFQLFSAEAIRFIISSVASACFYNIFEHVYSPISFAHTFNFSLIGR